MRIEVKKEISSKERHVYFFTQFGMLFVFTSWHCEKKEEGKRKFKITSFWDKYGRDYYSMCKEPELPDEIKIHALQEIQKYIKVQTWEEYKKQ